MELRQLRHFVAVAEERNFSVAARRVCLSQPALTRSIRTLEEALGARLLDRGPQGAAPTPAGERLLLHARMILNDCERARDELRTLREGVYGSVSVGVAALFSSWVGDVAVHRACEQLPGIELVVTEGYYENLLDMLAAGELDFALTNFPPTAGRAELATETLLDLRARVVCGAAHPLARRRGLSARDLAEQEWVVVNQPHSIDFFRQFCAENDLELPRFVRTNSLALLRSLVIHGRYLSIVVEPVVQRLVRRGLVRALNVEIPSIRRKAGLVYVRRPQRPDAVERVMEIFRESCRESGRGEFP